jgi:hypothetical protein
MIEWVLCIVVFLLVWTGVSIAWFLMNLGNKHGKSAWWEHLFVPPVYALAAVMGFLYSRFG